MRDLEIEEALHEPLVRKRQRAAALQDASEGHVLAGFREVLDCASPLALWLPLQKWVHGTDARPLLEVEALHEPQGRARLRRALIFRVRLPKKRSGLDGVSSYRGKLAHGPDACGKKESP